MGGYLQQMLDGDDLQTGCQAGLFGIDLRHQQSAPGFTRRQRGREYALHRAHRAGERQFAEAFVFVQRLGGYLAAGSENAQCYGEVEAATILGQIGRCQIERDAFVGKLEGRIENRAAHAILAFLDRGFRQAHQGQGWQAVGQVRLDGDGWCFDADLGAAVDYRQGHDHSLIRPTWVGH